MEPFFLTVMEVTTNTSDGNLAEPRKAPPPNINIVSM